MAISFTKSQQKAITARNHNILVSASAGAGKTATLTTRILNRLREENNETHQLINIDELLIVTFTKKAAGEMKERLQNKLTEAIQHKEWDGVPLTNEEISHFEKQLLNIVNAPIGTIDSFCQRIVKDYYYLLEDTALDANPRTLTHENELQLLMDEARDKVRDAWLDNEDPKQVEETKDRMTQLLDEVGDDLEIVNILIQKMRALPEGEAILDDWLENVAKDGETLLKQMAVVAKELFNEFDTYLDAAPMSMLELQEALELEEDLGKKEEDKKKKIEVLEEANANIDTLYKCLDDFVKDPTQEHYIALRKAARPESVGNKGVFHHSTLKKIESINPLLSQALRYYKAPLSFDNPWKTKVMALTQLETEGDKPLNLNVFAQKHYETMATLVEVTKDIFHTFQAIKAQKQLIDFADMEQFAYHLVTQHDEVRQFYKHQFQEIMIDEYQDVNDLQQQIMETISNGHNLFMVGDIKQSIYGFRQANPQLFNQKLQDYQGEDNDDEVIILPENFRSRHTVLMFINKIFKQLMTREFDNIVYDKEAELVVGHSEYCKEETIKEDPAVEFLVYDEDVDTEHDDLPVSDSLPATLAIAMKRLHEQEKVPYDKIAILVDKRSSYPEIQSVMEQLQIPYVLDKENNYFKTTEISQVVAYLTIIDNPYQDIPFVSVLKSPFVGLTETELVAIQIAHKEEATFYERCLAFTKDEDKELYEKLQVFLDQLDDYREKSRRLSVHDLVWDLYQETHFIDYIRGIKNGAQRVRNLHALYEKARQYEENSFKGLYQFIKFIDKLKKNDVLSLAPFESDDEEAEGVVHIMTVHYSKGLEFPYVLYYPQKGSDNSDIVEVTSSFGLMMNHYTKDQLFKISHPLKQYVKIQRSMHDYAEKFRDIYVALTRAEQKLMVIGKKNKDELFEKLDELSNHQLSSDFILSCSEPFQWLVAALYMYKGKEWDIAFNAHHFNYEDVYQAWISSKEALEKQDAPLLTTSRQSKVGVVKEAMAMLSCTYPKEYQAAMTTANYASVTDLKRRLEDPDMQFTAPLTPIKSDMTWEQPKFMQEETVSATKFGTAVHLVMEKLDPTKPIDKETVESLIQYLVSQGLMEEAVARKISVYKILRFFDSIIGQAMIHHPEHVFREKMFSMLLDAAILNNELADEKEQTLVHGIIDGYIVLDDRVLLYDYKTNYRPETQSVEDFKKAMIDQYHVQMFVYQQVLQLTYPNKKIETYLYLFAIDEAVQLTEEDLNYESDI